MTIPSQYSRYLIGSTPTSQSPKRMSKSILNILEVILANNDLKWVNAPEVEKPLDISKKCYVTTTPSVNRPFS